MRASHESHSAEASPHTDAAFQNFLLELAAQLSAPPSVAERIDCFCRALRSRFDASAVYYWESPQPGMLQAAGCAGRALRPPQMPRLTPEVNPQAFRAVLGARACLFPALHRPDAAKVWGYPARAALAVPVASGGEAAGLVTLFHDNNPQFFTQEIAAQVAVAAAMAGVAFDAGRFAVSSEQHRQRAENLMSLALELQPSMRLPDFARRFTLHAMSMLRARTGVMTLARGGRLEMVFTQWAENAPPGVLQRGLEIALYGLASANQTSVAAAAAGELVGRDLASALGWDDAVVVRLE